MSWAARWVPALFVALGAAVATAHGLYEVAHASKVPGPIAWLYPLVTDGLAMVAYSATGRLTGRSAGYAWTCVVLAAGLSGLAQAVYLAADTVVAAPVLRFGVGAWPAIACALVAHLLHLIVTADQGHQLSPDQQDEQEGAADEVGRTSVTTSTPTPLALAPGQDPAPTSVSDPARALTPAAGPAAVLTDDSAADDRAAEQDGQDAAADREHDDGADDEARGDGRVRLLVALLTGGADVTGPQAAALLSHHGGTPVSDRTARRLLATAREATRDASDGDEQPLEQATEQPVGRARLVLLPTGTSTTSTTSSTSSDSDEGDPR